MKKFLMPSVAVAAAALAASRPHAVLAIPRAEGAAGDVAKLLGEVQEQLSRIESDVKKTAEQALTEAKNSGKASDETKAKADELLKAQHDLGEAQSKLSNRLEALETRNTDLAQLLASRGGSGGAPAKSLGQRVSESDEWKAYVANGGRGSMRVSLPVKQAITSVDPGAGGLIWSDRDQEITGMPRQRLFIRNLVSQGRTNSGSIEYRRQTVRTNNAAMVSEGVKKPESDYKWTIETANVRTIAHYVVVSRQAMDDAAQLQTEIDTELRYGLALKEDLALLKGDGTGQNLEGMNTAATAYSAPIAVSGETMIDTLRLAILQAELAYYPTDGFVLHPSDWTRIETTKDSRGLYIIGNPNQLGVPSLWGRPVASTPSQDEDAFLVGAFKMAATIYDRLDPEVVISSEDQDNFVKNMLTVRAEERLAFAVKRAASLILGDFGNISG